MKRYLFTSATVGKKTLGITADDQSKTYGDTNPALTVSYSGFVNGDTSTALDTAPTASTAATAASGAGTYAINAAGGVDNDYSFSYTGGTLTIGKKGLTVTADDKSRVHGSPNPSLTVSYTGFVTGDDATVLDTAPTATTAATDTSTAGAYAITAAGGLDNNYDFTYIDGILTVMPEHGSSHTGGLDPVPPLDPGIEPIPSPPVTEPGERPGTPVRETSTDFSLFDIVRIQQATEKRGWAERSSEEECNAASGYASCASVLPSP
jgi:hypothetical protein